MNTASAFSAAHIGATTVLVEVEAAIGPGLPRTVLVGLPDAALHEAKERCKAAVAGVDMTWPAQLVTINLTPASLPKAGSHYDLAIVAAVLACAGIVPDTLLGSAVLFGELGLGGKVRPVPGLLPGVIEARRRGMASVIVPVGQAREAELVTGLTVWPVATLSDVIDVLRGNHVLVDAPPPYAPPSEPVPDLSDVKGQAEACWALEVAAAGGHHVFLHGAPGLGKSMLACRLPGLLPDLGDDEALEVSAIHSLVGEDLSAGLIRRPPFASPHHNASMAALIGGGSRIARPGSISLAHRGVLFMDEAPQFNPKVLDALRTPLEKGTVTIARSSGLVSYPARFQLVMAANPCPCGLRGTPGASCRCTPMAVRRYSQRLSGPIMDRIDIHQHLVPTHRALADESGAEPSSIVAARVAEARQRQRHRLGGAITNAQVGPRQLHDLPTPRGTELLDDAMRAGALNARGYDKIIRLAWTIADLAGHDVVERADLASALGLRQVDRWWAA